MASTGTVSTWQYMVLGISLFFAGGLLACLGSSPRPLVRAFAHSDCFHARPLYDALEHGFCSIEADIHLVDGAILVAHDRDKCERSKTLQALYLDPLRERVQTNGGSVFGDGGVVSLLVDVKTDGRSTYAALDRILRDYADILTEFREDSVIERAVTVLISGSRAIDMIASQATRFAAIDGRLPDLDRNAPATLFPMISADWKGEFAWRGVGALSEEDKTKLERIVTRCHEQGKLLRFWGLPDSDNVWRTLTECSVDVLMSDDLGALRDFLVAQDK